MNHPSHTWLKRGISALLLFSLVYFFMPLWGELRSAAALFRHAGWGWFGVAVVFQLFSYASLTWLNALALQPFQGRIGFLRLSAVLTSMAFIQVAVPSMGLSGVALRVHLLKKAGYRAEDSLASLVVESLGEVAAISALVLVGVSFILNRGGSVLSQLAGYLLTALFFVGVGGYLWLVLSSRRRTRVHLDFIAPRWNRLFGRLHTIDVERMEKRVDEFRTNMGNYRRVPLWKLTAASFGKVVLDVATLGAAFYMFDYPIGFSQLFIGYGLILLFSGSASLPGGLVMTEASAPVLFYWLGVPAPVALAAGLVYRLIAFWLVRFVGYFCWHALQFETPLKSKL